MNKSVELDARSFMGDLVNNMKDLGRRPTCNGEPSRILTKKRGKCRRMNTVGLHK